MVVRFDSLHAADMDKQISRYLTERGWFVQPPEGGQHETPGQLAKRLGMSRRHVCEGLRHPDCPSFYKARVGPTGRLSQLVSNPRLERFLTFHKRPTCNTKGATP